MKNQQIQENQYSFPYHYIPSIVDGYSENYTWSWGKQYLSALELIFNEIKEDSVKIKTIIDVGCGDGRLTRELVNTFPDKEVLGIDYSARSINLAKGMSPEVRYECRNLIEEKLTEKFDACTLVEVFEHIPIELCAKFVANLADAIKENGILYMTVPHKNKPVSNKHYQHFTLSDIERYFGDYFYTTKTLYIQRHDKILSALNHLMSNRLYHIQSPILGKWVYAFYKKHYLFTKERYCGRLYVKLMRRQ